jgi:hypothetical protein
MDVPDRVERESRGIVRPGVGATETTVDGRDAAERQRRDSPRVMDVAAENPDSARNFWQTDREAMPFGERGRVAWGRMQGGVNRSRPNRPAPGVLARWHARAGDLFGLALALALLAAACRVILPVDTQEYSGGNGRVYVDLDKSECDGGCEQVAAFIEYGSFVGQCPSPDASDDHAQVANVLTGHPIDSHKIVRAPTGDEGLPVLTGLSSGSRAFFAVLRDSQCAIVGWGCVGLDLSYQPSVTVPVRPLGAPSMGACYGSGCECPPNPSDGGDDATGPSSPACSTLIAAGALPVGDQAPDLVAGPALVAISQGFILAFREQSGPAGAASASSWVRTLRLGTDGTVQTPAPQPISSPCAGTTIADDGVGLTIGASGAGLLAASLPECDPSAGAGVMVYPVAGDGTLKPGNSIYLKNSVDLSLARAHALARSYSSMTDFELMFVSGSTAYDSTLIVGQGDPSSRVALPGMTPASAALVSSPTLRAQLVVQQGGGAQIYTSAATSPPSPTPNLSAMLPTVTTAAIAILPTGISGLTVGLGPATVVTRAFGAVVGSASLLPGSFASVDVTPLSGTGIGSFAIVAASQASMTSQVTANMGAPVGAAFAFSSLPVLADLISTFDGTHVATAWNAGVLAVGWLSRHELAPGDPKGGWALFACP